MRLFIAINFNDEIKDNLCNVIQGLKSNAARGNFTRRENLHVTVVFIGETTKVDAIKGAMDSVTAETFTLGIGQLGRFSRQGSDLYWVGIEKNNTLLSIHDQLSTELRNAGFEIERRVFKPHLTIGREVALNKDFGVKDFEKTIEPLSMQVTKISLMKSERIGGKLTYTEIYSKEL